MSCAGSTKSGRPCRRKPADGSDYCSAHAPAGVALPAEDKTRLLDLLKAGVPADVACQVVGLPLSTFEEWLEAGNAGAPAFAPFAADVEVARGEGETRYIAIISQHAKKDWRAGAWLLSRLNPDRYGQPPPLKPSDRKGEPGTYASDQAGL